MKKNPVVMITGAKEGIGAACAREFLRQGARLSLIDISTAPPAYDDGGALWTIGDITSDSVRRNAVSSTMERFGAIDVLINNAGIGLYASPSETSPTVAERIFAVNVSAVVGLSGLVLTDMRRRRSGAIVNMESIGGLVSLPWCAMYCASKHALHAYTKSLRHELRGEGIQVVSMILGIVDTRFREHVLGGSVPAGVADLKRAISPQSVARSVSNGLANGDETVFNPSIGMLFWSLDLLFPGVMARYLRRCWTPPNGQPGKAASAACSDSTSLEV